VPAWAKLRGAVRITIAVPGNFAYPTLIRAACCHPPWSNQRGFDRLLPQKVLRRKSIPIGLDFHMIGRVEFEDMSNFRLHRARS
jgi:hypothetical protein